MDKKISALTNNYRSAVLVLLLFLCGAVNAQVLQPVNGFGFKWKSGQCDSSLGVPKDTLFHQVSDTAYLSYSKSDSTLYIFTGFQKIPVARKGSTDPTIFATWDSLYQKLDSLSAAGVVADGTTITGNGTSGSPLVATVSDSLIQAKIDSVGAIKEPLQSGTGYVKKASGVTNYVTSIPNSDLVHSSIPFTSGTLIFSGGGNAILGVTSNVDADTANKIQSKYASDSARRNLYTAISASGTVLSLQDNATNGVAVTWTNRTITPNPTIVLNNITPTSVSTNSVTYPKQYIYTPCPAHGTVIFDSVGGTYYRDSACKTYAISKVLIPNGSTIRDSIKNESGKFTLDNDTLGGTGDGHVATPAYVAQQLTTKQNALTLTTTGTSGASTLIGSTLNIPQYSGGTPVYAGIGLKKLSDSSTLVTDTSVVLQLGQSKICTTSKAYKIMPQITYSHEEPIEILNIGNNGNSTDSANYVNTGFTKNNWATIEVWNMKYDTTAKTFSSPVISKPSHALELGLEGVTIHAVVPGKAFSSTWHEQFQVRATGLDGNTGISSGNYLQAKCPLFFEYQGNSTYGGDSDPWTGGSAAGALPFIWMQSNEPKLPGGEYVRLEQNNASATGGQLFFRKSRGTYVSKTASLQNDNAGVIVFSIFDGTNYENTARIFPIADTLATAGIAPQSLTIQTSATDSLSLKTRLRVFGNGVVNIGSNVFSATGTARFTVNGTALIIDSLGNFSRYNNSAITNGQLLIGNTSTGIFNKATLTGTGGTTITNGGGTITINSPNAANTIASQFDSAQTTARNIISITSPAADTTLEIKAYVNVTTLGIATISANVTYTPESGPNVTASFYTMGSTSVGLVAGPSNYAPMIIRAKASTTITVAIAYTGTGGKYNDKVSILTVP